MGMRFNKKLFAHLPIVRLFYKTKLLFKKKKEKNRKGSNISQTRIL